jgi:threonine dehydrogenase-like Zn-dependent dehydrogenase
LSSACAWRRTVSNRCSRNKELNLQFVLGYTPEEFAASLQHLAAGRIAAAPLVTGTVGVEGVAGAFDALANPDRHAKILIEPWHA